ncbi:hypothetical protein ASPWEDRAFT_43828 [Aspergillus wentii DTO 134E9]|uniref:Uncharacterized protein n=1 Tax=Aspergillus wentii DTO 134E9 TaxID=1073089 RepID=A0A1L9RAA1_ASPWE|nr:uncharacterized protein ASPWEDRAFT_43828 [Aspergillus wentii DTO 134E9]KAI9934418.1 hypothetical protein MW887_000032 [Aspergillus wentii]OJJ31829.1 hypothetical protein ASPWEDRAFT_43828 [Aspergillus wentii DTO 134E9]
MAILESEKRPRGLRLPSLSAMKSKKKSPEPSPPESPPDYAPLPAGSGVPVRPARPNEKQLPPNPLSYPADSIPTDMSVNPNEYHRQILRGDFDSPYPRPQVPVIREPSAPVQRKPPPLPKQQPVQAPVQPPVQIPVQAPIQVPVQSPSRQSPPIQQPVRKPLQSPVQSPPVSDEEAKEDLAVEDFIPEPEPEIDTADARAAAAAAADVDAVAEQTPSEESDNGPWTPADYDPVAPPLGKLHFACYQEHRSMPVANNLWYPLPCMTCHKYDREIRHRCVFCSLRICADCHQGLQKCQNRSLTQFMESLS